MGKPLRPRGEVCGRAGAADFSENTFVLLFFSRKSPWLGGTGQPCLFAHLTPHFVAPRRSVHACSSASTSPPPLSPLLRRHPDRDDGVDRRRRGWRSPVGEIQAMQSPHTVRITSSPRPHCPLFSPVFLWFLSIL